MLKKLALFLLSCCCSVVTHAQQPDAAGLTRLHHAEDTLRELSGLIFRGKDEAARQKACDEFIPVLVRALKTPHAFRYTFDSLKTISIQYPQDSTFRIFTWAMEKETGFYRHYGAIQLRTTDGQLNLFSLFDNSDYSANTDTITDTRGWYGCLYYNIVQRHYFNQEYYTLFGWDANNIRSQKKVMDMLTFKNGKPVLGGPFFSFAEDTVPKPGRNRFIIEYKKDASATLNYNKELDMVVFDHLISESNEPGKKYTYVSDMDYEGFKWKAGKWVHVEKIHHDAIPLGKGAPAPQPLDMRKKNLTNVQTWEEVEAAEQAAKEKKKGTKVKKP